tara:strand:+ start:1073 stop:1252 length:180 start_codon:yes stop_codon:yes gene_type:complete
MDKPKFGSKSIHNLQKVKKHQFSKTLKVIEVKQNKKKNNENELENDIENLSLDHLKIDK